MLSFLPLCVVSLSSGWLVVFQVARLKSPRYSSQEVEGGGRGATRFLNSMCVDFDRSIRLRHGFLIVGGEREISDKHLWSRYINHETRMRVK